MVPTLEGRHVIKRLSTHFKGEKISGSIFREGGTLWVQFEGETFVLEESSARKRSGAAADDKSPDIKAPMPGKITKILVARGEEVSKGQVVLMMEAMKMEYSLKAKFDGVVEAIHCQVGEQVPLGSNLMNIKS